MRFLIGGERVTCRGLNLPRANKLTNSLGKQQLALWTRTSSGCAPLKLSAQTKDEILHVHHLLRNYNKYHIFIIQISYTVQIPIF